jgi:hypothetical protein
MVVVHVVDGFLAGALALVNKDLTGESESYINEVTRHEFEKYHLLMLVGLYI